jgi:neutral ceramidase
VGSLLVLSTVELCPREPGPPEVAGQGAGEGLLLAGAASVDVAVPYPISRAGYPPLRPDATGARRPPGARALVLQAGEVRVGLVALDVLLIPEKIAQAVRERASALELGELWVAGTHAHSSLGAYDPRALFELAALGGYRAEAEAALVEAAGQALVEAARTLTPARLRWGQGRLEDLVRARSEGPLDARLTRVRFEGANGPIGEVWIAAAHPTLEPRREAALSPDYPGMVEAGAPVLVLQGAAGNASAVLPEATDDRARGYARALSARAQALLEEALARGSAGPEQVRLAHARVRVPLGPPDGRRLLPGKLGSNLLCEGAPKVAELSLLQVGPLRWLSVPGEPTGGAGRALEEAAGAQRVVSLVGGYVGYVDEVARVRRGEGEARRQYYGEALLEWLQAGATLAARALEGE